MRWNLILKRNFHNTLLLEKKKKIEVSVNTGRVTRYLNANIQIPIRKKKKWYEEETSCTKNDSREKSCKAPWYQGTSQYNAIFTPLIIYTCFITEFDDLASIDCWRPLWSRSAEDYNRRCWSSCVCLFTSVTSRRFSHKTQP